ncbi:MAG TPA: hypothetical protein VMF30_19555 [Pirellulales bacterium]|nr:hypothetical protein [Pirellulales bacterium]
MSEAVTEKRSNQPRSAGEPRRPRLQVLGICALIVAAVGLVFGQTAQFEFINVDDAGFVFANPHITPGVTLSGIRWAFTDGPYGEWTPLTDISHMLDCQFFGTQHPGLHHLTNVVLHAASSVLLFLVLLRMTGQRWLSAWVALVFAIHPLHVSTVAWVSERREVLAGLFFMLTLAAYVRYVERPSLARYVPVALFLAAGLMSKAMLVTVPMVLLLLDYWPLARFQAPASESGSPGNWLARLPVGWRLVVEKIPLFCLSATSCTIVMVTHASFALSQRVDHLSLATRLGNAAVAAAAYVGQSLLPIRLSPFYPNLGSHMPAE